MVGAISSVGSVWRSPYLYRVNQPNRQLSSAVNAAVARTSESSRARTGLRVTAARQAQPEVPVQPAEPVKPVRDSVFNKDALLHYMAADPAEGAVRSRIQYLDYPQSGAGEKAPELTAQSNEKNPGVLPESLFGQDEERSIPGLPGQDEERTIPGLPGQDEERIIPGLPGQDKEETIPGLPGQEKAGELHPGETGETKKAEPEEDEPKVGETPTAQEVAEEGECQTCKKRKYQDGSDDPGVSFKTPTNVDPRLVQSAVRGHENEHVVRERAKALQEDRKVVSQSVSYRNAICPECGKVYLAGGTTRTVTINQPKPFEPEQDENEEEWKPFSVLA